MSKRSSAHIAAANHWANRPTKATRGAQEVLEVLLQQAKSQEVVEVLLELEPELQQDTVPAIAPETEPKSAKSPIQLLHNPSYDLLDGPLPEVNVDAVKIEDLVGMPDLVHTFQFNFSVDVPLILGYLHPRFVKNGKITFVTGTSLLDDDEDEELQWAKKTFTMNEVVVTLSDRFGSHHTKMMVNRYEDSSIEFVIMTCNLTKLDFGGLTQMVWRSGRLNKSSRPQANLVCGRRFEADMITYLRSYHNPTIDELANSLGQYDYGAINIEIVASVPGRYSLAHLSDDDSEIYGYGKLRQILQRNNLLLDNSDGLEMYNVLAQVTSIAYPYAHDRNQAASMFSHLLAPLIFSQHGFHLVKPGQVACRDHQRDHNYRLQMVFPTVDEVANSNFGFMSGSAVHFKYTGSLAHKNQFVQNIKPYLHRWSGSRRPGVVTGREQVTPHVKIYACDNADNWKSLRWMMVGSHNLSRQAWGDPDKRRTDPLDGSVYDVGSYELSVWIPGRLLPVYGRNEGNGAVVRLPFKVPPMKYGSEDQAWSGHFDYGTKKDTWGNTYRPD